MKGLGLALVGMVVLVVAAVAMSGNAEAVFVYACTPVAGIGLGGGGTQAVLSIYNPNTSTENVAAKWLSKTGVNLSGVMVPCGGCTPGFYPGQTGANTVTIAPGNTLITPYQFPDGGAALDGNVATTIRVVSDLPVNVGWTFFNLFNMMCTESL